jgi:hypothetical protein
LVQVPPAPAIGYPGGAMAYENVICPVCDKEIEQGASAAKQGDKVIHLACITRRKDEALR